MDALHKKISPSTVRMSSTEPSSNLENAMQLMIQTFHKYSGNEGDKYTLSKGELKELLTAELGNYLGNAQDKDAVDKVMKDLDGNNDGEVDFTEFIILVGALTVACNDFFQPEKKE
ncbi:protein S100-A1 protein-like [Arapaima gigas]